jgi:hypothetical protein
MPKQLAAEKIPHSWAVDDWPPFVFPNRASRGRYIIRMHKTELVAIGALKRIGRGLVVIGSEYATWLQKQGARVDGFEIAPNRSAATASAAAA